MNATQRRRRRRTFLQGGLARWSFPVHPGEPEAHRQYGGWGLVAVLGVVSVVVINNTIRLTVFARRKEINIMKFVGATNAFIRLPFFVEGMTVGAISGVLATGMVGGAYYGVLERRCCSPAPPG
ncbi:MAG: FtsX-like permease family protein [Ruthenibacterium lactatiformans]